MMKFKGFTLIVLMCVALQVLCQRSRDKMYYKFDSAASCFVTLNGTHQFGCSTPAGGNVGVLHIVEKAEDLSWLLKQGQAVPYMVVITPSMFKREVLIEIKTSGKVNGVFLAHDPSKPLPPSFSHEDTCPNRYSGLSSLETQTCGSNLYPTWNPNGTSLLLENWGMPIFYTNNGTHLADLIACAKEHNTKYSPEEQPKHTLCALEMRSHMFAAVDSKKCMQRRRDSVMSQAIFCDPLGGRNVWYSLYPRVKPIKPTEESRSVIMVAARMDSTSMFEGLVPGAVSAVTGLVTLLTTAALLTKMIPDKSTVPKKNVLFTIFDGESYDYIGSSRMVYDIQRGVFPVEPVKDSSVDQPATLALDHIGLFVELGHLTKPSSSLFAHLSKPSDRSYQTQALQLLTEEALKVGVNITALPPTLRLPPASAQNFIKADNNIPTIILTDFNDSFTYGYYHSVFDGAQLLRYKYANKSKIEPDSIQQYLGNIATTLARSLYKTVLDKDYTGSETVELDLVDELLYCYLESANCKIFSAVLGQEIGLNKPAPLYTSVYTSSSITNLMTGGIMTVLTGTPTDMEKAQCLGNTTYDTMYKYVWSNPYWRDSNHSAVCVKSTMNFSIALSPAFELEDYDMSSGKYSTWTESRWQEYSVRMFLKPPRSHDIMMLAIGSSVMVLSFVIVYFIKSRSAILFNSGVSEP